MKRFIVFANKYFDAKGGFMDYLEEFDTLPEAKKFTKNLIVPSPQGSPAMDGWWQIVDTEQRMIYLSNHLIFNFPNEGKLGRRTFKQNENKTG